MSNGHHIILRVVALAVIAALHWFPHVHAEPSTMSAERSDGIAAIP